MTRIIGGTAGGRRLETPKGSGTRPTSDRVREALFSSIESWAGSLQGLRFLDLYAGTGAVGLEAWSRGATSVTLVESHRRTALLIRSNARTLGAAPATLVLDEPVAHVLRRPVTPVTPDGPALTSGPVGSPYDIVFSDPPYPLDEPALAADLASLVTHGWLRPGSLVVVERSSRSPEPTWPDGFERVRSKRYGESVLWYAHTADPPP